MQKTFEKHINNQLSFLKDTPIILAVSGGVDSVVLTHLCHQLNLNMVLAHCNFGLRGDESDTDEAFVKQLAERLHLAVYIKRFDTQLYAQQHKRSIQMAARELRYSWFEKLANQLNFPYILTAHHADDNLETFLINFSRGSGLEGFTGIPEINGSFVRPLLPFSSDAIVQYAHDNHIKWRNDSSNKSVKYLRNKLRHEVIPILKEINPSFLTSFQNTLNHLHQSSSLISDAMSVFFKKAMVNHAPNEVTFVISEFKKVKHPQAYLYEALKTFGFSQWEDIYNLLDAETGKQVFSKTHRLIKNREHLLLTAIAPKQERHQYLVTELDSVVEIPSGFLFLNPLKKETSHHLHHIYVDKSKLIFPLKIRKKQEGDLFYPTGMTGKKKLSKYFKDEKMSLIDKENRWLLCSHDNQIIWVLGKRADSRYQVTARTKQSLQIAWKPQY